MLSVVRYGNVLGSRGSVIPFWHKLIQEGATSLPITDKRMTRFWITLEQSVDFVMDAFGRMRGGEIYVPKIPSMRIEDLALALAPNMPHRYTGIREGEKLHELMVGIEDARHTLEYDDHYLIMPEIFTYNAKMLNKFLENRQGIVLPENFSYCSQTNTQWLTVEQLQKLIHPLLSVSY